MNMTLLVWIKYVVITLLITLVIGAALVTAFLHWHPVFGGTPDAASRAKIQASKQFDGTQFVNAETTPLNTGDGDAPGVFSWLKSVITPPPGKQPGAPLPSQPLQADQLHNGSFAWLGHSTVLFKTADKVFITDPVFYRASPIPLGGRPFPMRHVPRIADLPPIDAVLISHDHYDHLDYRAIQALDSKVGHFFVPLGVKAHLQRWGVRDEKITELDWHESATLGAVRVTLAPARHFSGRGLNNRGSTLWGSWVVKSPELSLFFNGDSGYGKHFADIGAQYGPFDLAFIENGAYNPNWALIHMVPEQSVQAALDVGAKAVVPIHWAKFDLSYHPWKEPIQRFITAAKESPLHVATPQIGQIFGLMHIPQTPWWEAAP